VTEDKDKPERKHEIWGIVLLGLAAILSVAIWKGPGDPAVSCTEAHVGSGAIGACVVRGSVLLLGLPATWLIPLAMAIEGLHLFRIIRSGIDKRWLLFIIGLIALVPIGLGLWGSPVGAVTTRSGLWGGFTSYYLDEGLGAVISWILLLALASILAVVTIAFNPLRALLSARPPSLGMKIDAPAKASRRK